jgi:hypothetical protein
MLTIDELIALMPSPAVFFAIVMASIDELIDLLSADLSPSEKKTAIFTILNDLSQAEMLVAPFIPPPDLDKSRRDLLRKAAAAGLFTPILGSILAPTPSVAGSDFYKSMF